jgi:hypothetical protein
MSGIHINKLGSNTMLAEHACKFGAAAAAVRLQDWAFANNHSCPLFSGYPPC